METDGIPQINPDTGLFNPPKISLDVAEGQGGGGPEKTFPTKKSRFSRFKFKVPKFRPRNKKVYMWLAGTFALLAVITLFLIVIPGFSLYKKSQNLIDSGFKLQNSLDTNDISIVKAELQSFKSELKSFQGSYNRFKWTSPVPFVGQYWKDGDAGVKAGLHGIDTAELVIAAIEPYADIIGFAGEASIDSESGEDTANDRIEFIIQTIDEVIPKLDEITKSADLARTELDKIDPNRYPEEFRGIRLRDKMKQGLDLAHTGADFVADSKPLLEAAPFLLGIDDSRRYLLLFQNDKELRPTGGFITAYSIVDVDKGKLNPVSSSDIYKLDSFYTPSIDAPQPIIDYIRGPYVLSPKLRLRDMNWSPDFRVSMELFLEEAADAGIEEIDGVIAVDTQVVVMLLEAIGQIGVPGFGNFSADTDPRCDCPQVVYELESFADIEGPIVWSENEPGKIVFAPPNYDNRKKIVGPLMNSVIANALGQPKDKIPALFEVAWKSITEKHVLLYLFDEEAQNGVERFGIAGKIEEYDGDYLHVNDANLGGRKSNLYLINEISQEVEIKGGEVTKTLMLTYKNPQTYDGWLNSVLPNWTRVYVPEGSELISIEGFEDVGEVYNELGKTVFSGGFELRPEGVKKMTIKYKLPFKVDDDYKLFIQKQPGLDAPLYTIKVGRQTEELFLRTDKEFKFRI